MEDQGAAIDILSVQNESDYDPEGYEGCLYTVDEMTHMVTALRQHFHRNARSWHRNASDGTATNTTGI